MNKAGLTRHRRAVLRATLITLLAALMLGGVPGGPGPSARAAGTACP